jgi:hypothetical protein
VATIKELLRKLDLGASVAEFDEALEKYFVETDTFHALVDDRVDIVAGDKGTGKTAIYRILQKRFGKLSKLQKVEVVPAFNPTGNPVFQRLGEQPRCDEGVYIRFWKTYIFSLIGNCILHIWEGSFTPTMHKLDTLLREDDLREDNVLAQSVFNRALQKLASWFRPKSASVQIAAPGLLIKPQLDFDNSEYGDAAKPNVRVDDRLKILDKCLEEAGYSVWVAVDRLDEAFQGFPDIEIPALRALLRSYLDLLEFSRIRLKLFVRRDLFRRIIGAGFVNLTHVNARKIEVIWDEEDLLNLLCRRIRENTGFADALNLKDLSDNAVFERVFPRQVDVGKRKPQTWTWIMRRIRDGNDIKPPRNLIDLISMAQQAQMRREEREEREYTPDKPIIEADALRRALTQLSEQRVNDTLFAEAGGNAHIIERFRNGKAEHNNMSLAELLGMEEQDVRRGIQPLIEMGFLEDIRETYKVPALYRDGLKITQGKAFEVKGDLEEGEDEEE